ncbi:prepilin-type N-terminal cleavage/methylation domain-containing protein [Burkholderia cepacia]|uniref:prepilin-type N-terminal cleavage/methylation domain-containing protein n=1 Tax=Burkholderia cepacia TaxID=292 RepID=UPI00158D7EE7|nr:prepilin-type N-terminal cleavage/methylation domain-containing protein [Burkholderia cepacia]
MNNYLSKITKRMTRTYLQRGFTLIELSVVLVVIAIIVGITVVGMDVYRNAVGVRIYSDFVQGWQTAYSTYFTRAAIEPGDDSVHPIGRVNGMNYPSQPSILCDNPGALLLTNAMLAEGVQVPNGRGQNQAASVIYRDKSGTPRQLTVCLATIDTWWEPWVDPQTGSHLNTKTVLVLAGLTPDLAGQLSTMIDGHIDVGLGSLREAGYESSGISHVWSLNATRDMFGGTDPEQQSAVMTGYLVLR